MDVSCDIQAILDTINIPAILDIADRVDLRLIDKR